MGRETKKTQVTAYAASGVDIDAASRTVELIKRRARARLRPEVLADIGAFAGAR